MRSVLVLLLAAVPVAAQVCPPARMLPSGRVVGSLGDSSCRLSDSTVYDAYRLDLPVRGALQLDVSTDSDFILTLQNTAGQSLGSGRSIRRPLEAGSYTLLVNGSTPGQVGAYTVQSAFTAEPGMWCSAFAAIGPNQTVTGTLGASGCLLPDGTAYEAHALHTYGSGTLTVTVNSRDFLPQLFVRDAAGRMVASGTLQATVPVDDDSQYLIVVNTQDTTGAYELSTAFEPAEDETCRARPLADSDAAVIGPDSCSTVLAGSGVLAFFNYHTFHLATPGFVDLVATSPDFVPALHLLDSAGNAIAADDGELRIQLPPGDYIVQVFSPLPNGGAYQLRYQFSGGMPQACATLPLNPGDKASGTLSAASCRTAFGAADIYAVTLPASGNLQLAGLEGTVAIRDLKDNLLVAASGSLSADLPAGAYTIVAAGSGDYQLATTFTAQDVPACDFVQPLDLNGGYIQKLRPGSCRDADGQLMDLYGFTLPSDSTVLAVMTSREIDSFLRLTDENGNVMRFDDNSYGENAAMIVQYLPAGNYRLAARAAGASAGGFYQVDLRTSPGPRPSFCAPAGAPKSGTLSYGSCQYPDGTFTDIYEISLSTPATVDVQVSSTDFVPALIVLDAKGNVVDEDDTDAHLTLPLAAGKYCAVAKAASGYSHIGAYSLTMSQQ